MAESSISVGQDQFSCPICLELLNDPVAIPCGHSYCMGCIQDCWNLEDRLGVYSCPQCRQTFTPRPILGRNTMLAEVVEKLKKSSLHEAPLLYFSAGTGDVMCDVCTGRKVKAVKSCLVCLASYCLDHLQPHYESPAFQNHKMTDATGQLQDKICSKHSKLLEIYCHTDQQCICYLCTLDEHRGHDTVSAAAERSEKQKQLEWEQQELKMRISDTQKKMEELKKAMDSFTLCAQAAVDDSERICTELVQYIEKICCDVIKLIRDQEKGAVGEAEGILGLLQGDICKLTGQVSELEHLLHTEDDINFLQRCVLRSRESGTLRSISVKSHNSFGDTINVISQLKEQLEDIWKKNIANISETVNKVHIIQTTKPRPCKFNKKGCNTAKTTCYRRHVSHLKVLSADPIGGNQRTRTIKSTHAYREHKKSKHSAKSQIPAHDPQVRQDTGLQQSEPKTRAEFLQYACELTLDPNTANEHLCLSEANRAVVWQRQPHPYPDHPERFNWHQQVLCKESLSGRSYWEVEWNGNVVGIAVTYKGISRKGVGNDCCLGCNSLSCSLYCSLSGFSFMHNNERIAVSGPCSSRIGVYLDHRAGTLSFYSVSDTMSLIHRVQTTFSEPLCPGFWFPRLSLFWVVPKLKLCQI